MKGSEDLAGFWIKKHTVIAPDVSLAEVNFYRFPRGSRRLKPILGISVPSGAAISK